MSTISSKITTFDIISLPREIRDAIITTTLSDHGSLIVPHQRGDGALYFAESCNMYPIAPYRYCPLLNSNRQLRAETLEAFSLLSGNAALTCKLKCIIEREHMIYSTWQNLPLISTNSIPTVDVDFLAMYSCEDPKHFRGEAQHCMRSSWNWGCGGPGAMIWSLCALLTRFLERGPNFTARLTTLDGKKRDGVHVGTLALNVVTTEFFESLDRFGETFNLLERLEEAVELLLFNSHARDLAQIAFERISNITLSLDGTVAKGWDLKELYEKQQRDKGGVKN